jgi:hypothetical protein
MCSAIKGMCLFLAIVVGENCDEGQFVEAGDVTGGSIALHFL